MLGIFLGSWDISVDRNQQKMSALVELMSCYVYYNMINKLYSLLGADKCNRKKTHSIMELVTILCRIVRTGLTKKVLFRQSLGGGEGFIHRAISGRNIPANDESMPRVWLGSLLVWSRNSRKAEQSEQSQQGGLYKMKAVRQLGPNHVDFGFCFERTGEPLKRLQRNDLIWLKF